MCWKYHGMINLAVGHLENLPGHYLFLAMYIDMYRWSLNEHSYNIKVQMAVQQGELKCLWCHQVTKEAACWLILEEEQVNLSLVACVSKKVPEMENVCPSSPFIVCRTKSSRSEACCAGWFGSDLRHSCYQSPGYKACLWRTSSWRHGLFLEHWNGLSALPHFSLFSLAQLCSGHCAELCTKMVRSQQESPGALN